MTDRLRFGIFMAPFHQAGENPTLAIERDLELDRSTSTGSAGTRRGSASTTRPGTEIIASPEIFIAAAAERTRHIKLGTGVISVAYHNPYMVAERAVLLDHLTRGPVHARRRAGLAADRRDHARPRPDRDPAAARGGPRRHHAAADDRGAGLEPDEDVEPRRRPPAPAAVLEPAVRRRRAGRGLAVGPAPRRQVRRRPAVDRRHPGRRVRRARPALGRDGGAGGDVRHRRRPGQVAARRADAHRRDQGAGGQGRRVRHPRSGSTTSSTPRRSRRWTSAAPTRCGR